MKWTFSIYLLLTSLCLSAQPSTHATLQPLSKAAQLDYIIENIYAIRSADMDSGLHYITYALGLANEEDNQTAKAKCLLQMGVITYLQGKYEVALSHYQDALDIAEKINDKSLQGRVLNELANYTKQQKEYNKALGYLKKSEGLCRTTNDTTCFAAAIKFTGVIKEFTGDLDSAALCYEMALSLQELINDSLSMSYTYNDLSSIAISKKEYERAITLINQSSRIRAKLNDRQGIAINLNNIGEVYREWGRYRQSIPYFEESIKQSKALKFTALTQWTYNLIADSHLKIGEGEKAYTYAQEAMALKDSLYSTEKAKAISEMQIKYDTEKKEQLLLLQQQQNKAQRNIALAIILGLLLLGAVAYYRFYKKQVFEQKIKALEIKEKIQQERQRISRDLHDNVGAQLTNIATNLDMVAYQTKKKEAAYIQERIDSVGDNARDTIQLLRETIWAIHQDSFTISEFTQKVEDYLQKYLTPYEHMTYHFHQQGAATFLLSPTQALNLFRIVQEAIQNTVKYAEATTIDIYFDCKNGFEMAIIDNGKGMDLSQEIPDNHYGLQNMQHRAEEIGGLLHLESFPQKGFEVKVTMDVV